MTESIITLIAALARNRAIGFAGKLPWYLPGELQHFKQATMGKSIVMGRRTWESIGRVLPGRQNIVVTRNPVYQAEGCLIVNSLAEALEKSASSEVMIIGGGQLYEQAMPQAMRMILTLVDCEPEADTWFPAWSDHEWREIRRRSQPSDGKNTLAYEVVEFVRLSPPRMGTG